MASTDITLVIQAVDKATTQLENITARIEALEKAQANTTKTTAALAAAQEKAAAATTKATVQSEKATEGLKSFAVRGAVVVGLLKKLTQNSEVFGTTMDGAMKLAGKGVDYLLSGLGKVGKAMTAFASSNEVDLKIKSMREQIQRLDDVIEGRAARTTVRSLGAFKGGIVEVREHEEAIRAATGQRLKDAQAMRDELAGQLTKLNDMARAAKILAEFANEESIASGASGIAKAREAQAKATADAAKATHELVAASDDEDSGRVADRLSRIFAPLDKEHQAMAAANVRSWWRDLKTEASRFAADTGADVDAFISGVFDKIQSIELPEPERILAPSKIDIARADLETLQATARALDAMGFSLANINEEIELAQWRVFAEEIAAVAEAFGDSAVNADALFASMSRKIDVPAVDKITEKADKLEDALLTVGELADRIGSGFADAFLSIIDGSKSAADAFRQMAASILSDVARMLVSRSIANVISTAFGGPSAKAFQHGGAVVAGAPVLVGERGPELFVPGQSGYVNNANASRGGGGVVVNFQISAVDGPSVQAMLVREADTIKALISRAAASDHRFRAGLA